MLLTEDEAAKQTTLWPPLSGNKQTKPPQIAARCVSLASFLGSKVERQLGVTELISPVPSLHYLSSCSQDTDMGETAAHSGPALGGKSKLKSRDISWAAEYALLGPDWQTEGPLTKLRMCWMEAGSLDLDAHT